MTTAPRTLVWLRAAGAGLLLTALAGCSTLSLNEPPPNVTPRYAYVTDSASGQVLGYVLNSNTGALTPLGSFAAGTGPASIGGDATGAIVYVANASGTVSGFIVNATSGTLQPVPGTFTAGSHPVSI